MKPAVCIGLLFVTAMVMITTGCSGGARTRSNPSSPPESSVQVLPTSMSIGMGHTQQFNATAHLSDESTKDVTNSAQRSSSDSNIANVTDFPSDTPAVDEVSLGDYARAYRLKKAKREQAEMNATPHCHSGSCRTPEALRELQRSMDGPQVLPPAQ